MKSIVKKDVDRLMRDMAKVEESMQILEQTGEGRPETRPCHDLTPLASGVVHLDFDLRTMLLDCAILGRHDWKTHNLPLILSLHCSLDVLHGLLNDLNNIRPSLQKARLKSATCQCLLGKWRCLKKSVVNLKSSLKYPAVRRKMARHRKAAIHVLEVPYEPPRPHTDRFCGFVYCESS